MKKRMIVLFVLATMITSAASGAAAVKFFNTESIIKQQSEKVDQYIKTDAPLSGSMNAYINQRQGELSEAADAYFEESKNKWLQNQETLSPEEKQAIDDDFDEALAEVKTAIDEKWKQYGGY